MSTAESRSPSTSTPMLSGFTSRWAYPPACMLCKPSRIRRPTTLASASGRLPSRAARTEASMPPFMILSPSHEGLRYTKV